MANDVQCTAVQCHLILSGHYNCHDFLVARNDIFLIKKRWLNCWRLTRICIRVIEGGPECFCPAGWSGDRCQLHQDSRILPSAPSWDVVPLLNASVASLNIIVISLAVASILLLLLVAALAITVHRLKQRPRIVRKRWAAESKLSLLTNNYPKGSYQQLHPRCHPKTAVEVEMPGWAGAKIKRSPLKTHPLLSTLLFIGRMVWDWT